jgi:hypothetical protein
MIARKQEGNIVNIASVLGFNVMKFLSPYTISMAGIVLGDQGDGAGARGRSHPRWRVFTHVTAQAPCSSAAKSPCSRYDYLHHIAFELSR